MTFFFFLVDGCRWGALQSGCEAKKCHRGFCIRCWCMWIAGMHYSKTECSKYEVPDSHWRTDFHYELLSSDVSSTISKRKLSFKALVMMVQLNPNNTCKKVFPENISFKTPFHQINMQQNNINILYSKKLSSFPHRASDVREKWLTCEYGLWFSKMFWQAPSTEGETTSHTTI